MNYKISLLAAVILLLSLIAFRYFSNPKIELNGKLLIPMRISNDKQAGMYSINLCNGDIQELYINKEYDEIKFPNITEEGYLFVGKIKNQDIYEIMEKNSYGVKKLYRDNKEIYYPTRIDDRYLLFIMKQNDNYGLYKYDISNKKIILLYKNADKDSRPVIRDKTILFTAKYDNNYEIIIQDDGVAKNVVKGRYPNWFIGKNQIIYYDQGKIHLYDLASNSDKTLKNNIILRETPILSPDKKYLAVIESDEVGLFSGATADFISIVEIKSGRKKHLAEYLKSKNIYSNNHSKVILDGLFWIK